MSEEEFGDFDYEPEEEVHPKFVTTAKKFIRHRETQLSEEQKEANDLKNGRYFKDVNYDKEVYQIENYDQFVRTRLLDQFRARKELLEEEEKRLKEQNLEIPEDLQEQLNVARGNEEYIKEIIDSGTMDMDDLLYKFCDIEVSPDHKTWKYTLREAYASAERMRIDTAEIKAEESMMTNEGLEKYGRYMDNCLVIKEIKIKLAKIKTLKIVTTNDVDKAVTALQKLESLKEMEPEHNYPIGTYVYDIIDEDQKQKMYERLFGGIETFDTTMSQIEMEDYEDEIDIIREFVTSFNIQIDEDTILYILQTFNISKYDENDNEDDEFFDKFAYIIGVIINLPSLIKLSHTITLDDFNKCLKEINFTTFYLSGEIKAELKNMIELLIVGKYNTVSER